VVWYTSVDLKLSEQIGKAFEAKYPGVTCKVERTGAERLLQRIGQEYTANVHAVDVVNSSDASHLVYWKDLGMLSPYVPEDVAKFYPADHKDADGMFASFRVFLCVIAYNTNLVKKEEAPKSFADLLDPKWKGKIIKAHPGYSGTIMTATQQLVRDLGWPFFEKLAQQNILQVQSAADPPKKLALGERAIQADGALSTASFLPNSGGITEMMKVAAICETHAVGIVPHFTGPIATENFAPILLSIVIKPIAAGFLVLSAVVTSRARFIPRDIT